jgi:putative chitinase
MKIEEQTLRRMWPRGDSKIKGLIAGVANSSEAVFAKYRITTPLQAAHIMSQLSHECGDGTEVVESLYYTHPEAMMKAWHKRFPTAASTLPFLRNERKLGNNVYGGRMGNRPGTNDGYDFRGRGGAQTTGREAYEKLGEAAGEDLVSNPGLLIDPDHFFDFAVADFIMCGCLPFTAPKPGLPLGDVEGVTLKLNGGKNGLTDRKVRFKQWCAVFGVSAKALPPKAPPIIEGDLTAVQPAPQLPKPAPAVIDAVPTYAHDAVLRYGQEDNPDFEVKAIQQKLVSLDYKVGRIDGDFSSGMRAAVLAFQADNGLPTTGEVDAGTKRALMTATTKPIAEARTQATADDLRAQGSGTIKAADNVSLIGKIAAALGVGGGAADQSGMLDQAKGVVDQVSAFRSVANSAADLLQWAGSHWYFGAALAGLAAWHFGSKIIARRLADHRSGANMSY